MASFLDNSGDIILDSVLTDEGRARLADGTFQISKFAVFDDEVNYALHNKSHASGSSYFDLDILALPILEALTNNTSYGKSKLLSIPRQNLLYLPVLKLNEYGASAMHTSGAFFLATELETEKTCSAVQGVLCGETPGTNGNFIRLDQGLDTTELSPASTLDADLVETAYVVECDNRLLNIVSADTNVPARASYIDDDYIASYYFTLNTDTEYVQENRVTVESDSQIIAGPRGTTFRFKLGASQEVNSSNYLFTLLGGTQVFAPPATSKYGSINAYYIDTQVRVMGMTTGYLVDIPVRLIRKV